MYSKKKAENKKLLLVLTMSMSVNATIKEEFKNAQMLGLIKMMKI